MVQGANRRDNIKGNGLKQRHNAGVAAIQTELSSCVDACSQTWRGGPGGVG